jgi:hypothetical protein
MDFVKAKRPEGIDPQKLPEFFGKTDVIKASNIY